MAATLFDEYSRVALYLVVSGYVKHACRGTRRYERSRTVGKTAGGTAVLTLISNSAQQSVKKKEIQRRQTEDCLYACNGSQAGGTKET